jgi:hypothetical protein
MYGTVLVHKSSGLNSGAILTTPFGEMNVLFMWGRLVRPLVEALAELKNPTSETVAETVRQLPERYHLRARFKSCKVVEYKPVAKGECVLFNFLGQEAIVRWDDRKRETIVNAMSIQNVANHLSWRKNAGKFSASREVAAVVGIAVCGGFRHDEAWDMITQCYLRVTAGRASLPDMSRETEAYRPAFGGESMTMALRECATKLPSRRALEILHDQGLDKFREVMKDGGEFFSVEDLGPSDIGDILVKAFREGGSLKENKTVEVKTPDLVLAKPVAVPPSEQIDPKKAAIPGARSKAEDREKKAKWHAKLDAWAAALKQRRAKHSFKEVYDGWIEHQDLVDIDPTEEYEYAQDRADDQELYYNLQREAKEDARILQDMRYREIQKELDLWGDELSDSDDDGDVTE